MKNKTILAAVAALVIGLGLLGRAQQTTNQPPSQTAESSIARVRGKITLDTKQNILNEMGVTNSIGTNNVLVIFIKRNGDYIVTYRQ